MFVTNSLVSSVVLALLNISTPTETTCTKSSSFGDMVTLTSLGTSVVVVNVVVVKLFYIIFIRFVINTNMKPGS